MRKLIVLIGLSISVFASAFGQNIDGSYQEAEKEINAVYQKILKEYSTDKVFVANLRASQRLWVQFRDAEIMARYPARTPGYYGSAHAACVANLKTELTNERIKTLRVWLTGIEEGDVCAGSVRIR